MILNLGHQHSKTRHVTLKAVGVLVVCGSDDLPKIMKVRKRRTRARAPAKARLDPPPPPTATRVQDQLLPTLKNLLQDRAASVRQQLVLTLGAILAHPPPPPKAPTPKEEEGSDDPAQRGPSSFEPRLLSVLLSLLSDETPPVAALALKTAEEAGSTWSAARGGGPDEQASATVFNFDPAAAAAAGVDASPRKAPGLQRMVCSLLGELVPIALEDSAHWTLATRHRGVLLVRVLVVYAADAIEAHVPQMLATLCTASADEEDVVREATRACATEIGRVTTGSEPPVAVAFIDALLAQAQGRVDGLDSAPHRRNALVVVSAAIGGLSATLIGTAAGDGATPNDPMAPHAIKVASALVDRGVLEIADAPLHISMLETCGALIASAPSACGTSDAVCRPLLRTLVQLMADTELCEAATEHVAKLAELCGCADDMALYERHFAFLLDSITQPEGGAISSLYQQQAFDVLMRTASSVAGPHLARVLQVFFEHAKVDSDPDARLRMMALLESVLANDQCARHATPFARQLITVLIVPNTVWKAGRVAATIRKVTIACLYTLLRAERVDEETLYVTAPQLLPILKTNLDDYDASTRQLVCLSLCMIFKALPNALGEDALRELYPALLKRLDDSSDDVRRAVCDTMCAFFLTSQPQNFRGTILEYSVEQLLVHLDDHDAVIQQAVAAVLRVAITLDAATVTKKLREIRTSHRSPVLCDELMAHAQGVGG